MSVTEAVLFTVTLILRNGDLMGVSNADARTVARALEYARISPHVAGTIVEMQDSITTEHPDTLEPLAQALRAAGVH